MTDENLALLRTHRNNINRYRRLLKTKLTECEPLPRSLSPSGFRRRQLEEALREM